MAGFVQYFINPLSSLKVNCGQSGRQACVDMKAFSATLYRLVPLLGNDR